MPRYSYKCSCGKTFDEFHTSFGAADRAEKVGIVCPKCKKAGVERNANPSEALKGGAFRRYGLSTYQ